MLILLPPSSLPLDGKTSSFIIDDVDMLSLSTFAVPVGVRNEEGVNCNRNDLLSAAENDADDVDDKTTSGDSVNMTSPSE